MKYRPITIMAISIVAFTVMFFSAWATPASAQVTIFPTSTDNFGNPDTEFAPEFIFYLLIKVDQAKDITGSALTVVYNNDAFELQEMNEYDGDNNLGYFFVTNGGIFSHVISSGTETGVSSLGNKDTPVQTERELHLAGAYPDPTAVTGGGGAYQGVQTLFKLKFKVKPGTPGGTYNITIKATELFNPQAGWYIDSDNSGYYQEGVDPSTPVQVPPLTGAYPMGTAQWNSAGLADDFFNIDAMFAAPLAITVTDIVDTDMDGISDDWEMTEFGDLITANDTTDFDHDGYSDKQEWINNTDPKMPNDPTDPNLDGYNILTDIRVANLDVDGNGSADGGTDGVIILRYMSGYQGDSLIAGIPLTGCTRCSAADIQAHLDTISDTVYDVDGNDAVSSDMDGKMILRYLSGYHGDEITSQITLNSCTRCTGAEIEAYLDLLD